MNISELERKVAEIRAKPLQLVCVTVTGRTRSMTVRECQETGARFLHVATDELDVLLGAELGDDNVPIAALENAQNARKCEYKKGQKTPENAT